MRPLNKALREACNNPEKVSNHLVELLASVFTEEKEKRDNLIVARRIRPTQAA